MGQYITHKLIFIDNLAYKTLNHQNPSKTALDMTVYVLAYISLLSRQIFIWGRANCRESHMPNIYRR